MFNMEFKSDGIAWIGNIYQKFEALCQEVDDIMIQEKAKYIESQVQSGCNNVRKFCAEVMQDLLLPACDVKGPVSDLSLIYDDMGICRKSKVGSPIEEKTLTPAELDVFVSSGKGSTPAPLPNEHYDLNEGEAFGALAKESNRVSEEVTGCECLQKADENNNYCLDAYVAVSSAVPTTTIPLTDVTASVAECKLYEPMLLPSIESLEKGHEQHNNELHFVLPSPDVGRTNDFDWEEAFLSSDALEPSLEATEEFEDVKPEEDCLYPEDEKNEVCFISVQDRKKTSYKKKLRDAFASRIWSAKKHEHEHLETHFLKDDVQTKHCREVSISTQGEGSTKNLSTHGTCESEWEIL